MRRARLRILHLYASSWSQNKFHRFNSSFSACFPEAFTAFAVEEENAINISDLENVVIAVGKAKEDGRQRCLTTYSPAVLTSFHARDSHDYALPRKRSDLQR